MTAGLRKILTIALIAGACAACSSTQDDPKPADPNVLPTNYKNQIIDYLRGTLDDPANIREAAISEPALKQNGSETRYITCLRYNAKDRDGAYAGLKTRAAFFYAGTFTTMIDGSKELCGNAAYQPFPELEKICRQLVCPKQ